MFIDIWDENNKAIKINKFSKDLITLPKRYDVVNNLVAVYAIVLEDNRIKTDYYQIYFDSEEKHYNTYSNRIKTDYYQIYFDSEEKHYNTYSMCFKDKLNFLTLFDCFTFLISDTFSYLYESENINFIEITAGEKVMFKYDNRK